MPNRNEAFSEDQRRVLTKLFAGEMRKAEREVMDAALAEIPANLSDLLDALVAFVRRFVVMTDPQFYVVATFIIHTYAMEAAESTPFLAVTSPEKGSGKTRLLEILTLLCRAAWHTIFPSEAVLYRKIDADSPTLLLDEVDAIFGPKGKDYEGVRALLNSGNRRGTTVARCTGKGFTLQEFKVFSPRVLAGIGNLPDTVADRSFPIRMVRRTRQEHIELFSGRHRREAETNAGELKKQIAAWANESNLRLLREAEPDLPEDLSDRQQDSAEPLLAIADLAGGPWPDRLRKALLALCTDISVEDGSIGLRLLNDIRVVFTRSGVDRLTSEDIVTELTSIEDAPWSDWYGKKFTARNVADKLRPFGISPGTIRVKTITKDGEKETTKKGYMWDQFKDAWTRYLPQPTGALTPKTAFNPSQPSQLNKTNSLGGLFDPSQGGLVTDEKTDASPRQNSLVTHVTAESIEEDRNEQAEEIDL